MRWRPLLAFAAIDFLSCLLVVFVAVAMTSARPQIETLGSYAVVMTWPAGNNDVDLYVRDPAGHIAYFDDMQVAEMQLEHDDLGTPATSYGKGRANEERTIIRSASPGQYVVRDRALPLAAPVQVRVLVAAEPAERLAHTGPAR